MVQFKYYKPKLKLNNTIILMYERTICGYKLKIHWYNWSLLLIPVIMSLTFVFQEQHKYIYAPINLGVCAMILFLNFPSIVVSLHSRPIYYDDLVIKDYNEDEAQKFYDDRFRRKYQKVFRTAIAVTSSVLVMITVELWYYRDRIFGDKNDEEPQQNKMVNFVVIISILGGLLRIYYAATMGIGKLVMIILKQIKKREQRLIREQDQEQVMYRLTQDGITVKPEQGGRVRQISLNMGDHTETDNDRRKLLPRTRSCNNISVVGFKPTLMYDIFNDDTELESSSEY